MDVTPVANRRREAPIARVEVSAFTVPTDRPESDYHRIPVEEQVEVVTLAGDIALVDHEPNIHAHVVLGRRDGAAICGHLLEARVRPTLELTLVETPASICRRPDPDTGLNLITL
jgi:uncharacterized protein